MKILYLGGTWTPVTFPPPSPEVERRLLFPLCDGDCVAH